MNENLQIFETNARSFTRVVDAVDAGSWDLPSPCEGWTAADVVRHVVDTQRDFFARQGLTLPDLPDGSPAEVWAAHISAVREVLTDEVAAREFDGYFGRTSIGATLVDFYGFDLAVHRWDLATATGQDCTFTDDELDQLEVTLKSFGDHAYEEGVFKRPVDVPADASRQVRVLALTGRDAAV